MIFAPFEVTAPADQFPPEALAKYPILRGLVEKINNAAEEDYRYMAVLTLIRNEADTALAIETSGGSGLKKTA